LESECIFDDGISKRSPSKIPQFLWQSRGKIRVQLACIFGLALVGVPPYLQRNHTCIVLWPFRSPHLTNVLQGLTTSVCCGICNISRGLDIRGQATQRNWYSSSALGGFSFSTTHLEFFFGGHVKRKCAE